MKTKEITQLGPIVIISRNITKEIKKDLKELESLLKDNPKFAGTLVEKILLVGKGVYIDEIYDLILQNYQNNHELYFKLRDIVYELGNLVACEHELAKKLIVKHPREEWNKWADSLRNEIKQKINDVFYSDKEHEYTITGELEQTEI